MAVSGISTASAAADSRFGDVMFQRFELVPDPADPGGDPLAAAPAGLNGISGDANGTELNAAINGAPAGFLDNVGAVDTDSSLRIAAINGTTDFVIAWTADDGAGGQEILYQIFTAGAAVDTWDFGPVAGGSGNDIIDGGDGTAETVLKAPTR